MMMTKDEFAKANNEAALAEGSRDAPVIEGSRDNPKKDGSTYLTFAP